MSVRTIYIAGVPASGKSTIFKVVRQRLFGWAAKPTSLGLYRGIENGPYNMCGVFDGSTYEGTDKLSMTAIDDAIRFHRQLQASTERKVLLVEGDRLLCKRFLEATNSILIFIEASDFVIRQRRTERRRTGEGQSETFLRAKRTKIENLKVEFAGKYRIYENNAPSDAARIANEIVRVAKSFTKEV